MFASVLVFGGAVLVAIVRDLYSCMFAFIPAIDVCV